MADQRLRTILAHLSPPVTVTALESPPLALPELGHDGHLLDCERPTSDREGKLIESLILSRLRRLDTHDGAFRIRPCRGELKSQDVTAESLPKRETRESQIRDPETESESREESISSQGNGIGDRKSREIYGSEISEHVRSGIASASASAVPSPGTLEKQIKSASHSRVAACKFCDVIQGTAPCYKLYEDELCVCILDVNPLCLGHSLILPKSHFPCLEATPPQVAAAMCAAVPLISRALLAATECDSFNMLVNNGVAAGQVIMHTHFHIIPRCKGDGLWKSEGTKRRPLWKVQEAKLLVHAVRSKLSSIVGPVTQ